MRRNASATALSAINFLVYWSHPSVNPRKMGVFAKGFIIAKKPIKTAAACTINSFMCHLHTTSIPSVHKKVPVLLFIILNPLENLLNQHPKVV
jgi:hypothetical protein